MGILTFIAVLILLFVFTRFIMRGFFDSKWRENIQEIIDGIKRERIFWNLMNGVYNKNVDLNVRRVFGLYIYSRTRELKHYDIFRFDYDSDDLDKNIIKKEYGPYKNIGNLNDAIKEREKSIDDFFDTTALIFTETEIYKKFEVFKEESKNYQAFKERGYIELDQLITLYFKLLNNQKTGMAIWKARKELEKEADALEFDISGYHRVDKNILVSLKSSQRNMGEFVISLISEKIENKETARKIEKSLREWEQLQMLLWCIVDNHAVTDGNLIQQALWRVVEYVFL